MASECPVRGLSVSVREAIWQQKRLNNVSRRQRQRRGAQRTGGDGKRLALLLLLERADRELEHLALVDAEQHVLGLDVRVDDLALGVQVVQALQHLQRAHASEFY